MLSFLAYTSALRKNGTDKINILFPYQVSPFGLSNNKLK